MEPEHIIAFTNSKEIIEYMQNNNLKRVELEIREDTEGVYSIKQRSHKKDDTHYEINFNEINFKEEV